MKNNASRREFLKISSLLAVGTSLSPMASFGASGKPTSRLNLGLASYTTRAFSLEETMAICQQLDLEYLSLKDIFHMPVGEDPEKLKTMAARVREVGFILYGGGVHYMRTREAIDATFAYARLTGLGMLIAVVPHDLLDYTNEKVIETGISVAIHNHGPGDDLYPTPESAFEKIKDLDPRFGLCIDIGHTQRSGACPAEDIIRFKDRVLDVHIKDVDAASAEGKTVEVGRGVIDIPAVLKALLQTHYQGAVAFEYEKDHENPVPGLAESVGYVRGVLAMI